MNICPPEPCLCHQKNSKEALLIVHAFLGVLFHFSWRDLLTPVQDKREGLGSSNFWVGADRHGSVKIKTGNEATEAAVSQLVFLPLTQHLPPYASFLSSPTILNLLLPRLTQGVLLSSHNITASSITVHYLFRIATVTSRMRNLLDHDVLSSSLPFTP